MRETQQAPPAGGVAASLSNSFNLLIGFQIYRREPGLAEGELVVEARHYNLSGIVHGGVYCAMLDAACGAAGLYCPHPGRARRSLTLSLTTQFTGMCRAGILRATGRVITAGRRIYTSRAEVHDETGRLVAHASGTFQYIRGSESELGEPVENFVISSTPPPSAPEP